MNPIRNDIGSKLIQQVKKNNVSKVREILRTHPDVVNYEYEWPVLMFASYHGSTECLRLLLQAGANPYIRTMDGRTSLSWASQKGHSECVRLLLEGGATRDTQDNNGSTPLMYASIYGNTKSVKLLLLARADPDLQDKDGWTALMLASYNDNPKCVRLLLQAGANPNLQDNNGETAYDLAETERIKGLLKNAMKAYPVMSLLGSTFKKKSDIPTDLVRKMVQEYLFSKKINNKKSKKN